MEPMFEKLGISLLLGMLVGLQREHAGMGGAGMRTFPLISVLGTASALLAAQFGGWTLAAGFVSVAAVVLIGHLTRLQPPQPTPGTTTDMAMLLMFAVGALLAMGATEMKVAIAVGGGVAVLLQFKPELHNFARRLGDDDLKAIMQFVLITCIILPVLPNRPILLAKTPPYDALNVLNPFNLWLMVVLIVAMSLGGYILYKFLGRNAGTLLGGVLGGAISSTATTVSYARGARGDPAAADNAGVVIMIASTISCLRVVVPVAVVAPSLLTKVAPAMGVLAVLSLLPALVLWLCQRRRRADARTSQSDAVDLGRGVRRIVCDRAPGDGGGASSLFWGRAGAVCRGGDVRTDGNGRHHPLHGAVVAGGSAGLRPGMAIAHRRGDGEHVFEDAVGRPVGRLAAVDRDGAVVCPADGRRRGDARLGVGIWRGRGGIRETASVGPPSAAAAAVSSRPSTLNSQLSTLDSRLSTLDSRLSTLDSRLQEMPAPRAESFSRGALRHDEHAADREGDACGPLKNALAFPLSTSPRPISPAASLRPRTTRPPAPAASDRRPRSPAAAPSGPRRRGREECRTPGS